MDPLLAVPLQHRCLQMARSRRCGDAPRAQFGGRQEIPPLFQLRITASVFIWSDLIGTQSFLANGPIQTFERTLDRPGSRPPCGLPSPPVLSPLWRRHFRSDKQSERLRPLSRSDRDGASDAAVTSGNNCLHTC
jgi:hypothetical protein